MVQYNAIMTFPKLVSHDATTSLVFRIAVFLQAFDFISGPTVAIPNQSRVRPVELGVHLSRRARRLLGSTGAVHKKVENLEESASLAAVNLWKSCRDRQIVVWLDNWYRKRFGTDPRQTDMSLNVSVLAILHITEVRLFEGHKSLGDMLNNIPNLVKGLSKVAARLISAVEVITDEDIQPQWIRVPLDIHREGMRSLQWTPYLLTEYSVSNQTDLMSILHDLQELQGHTKRTLPLLVDMDIHYRVMKLMYGQSTCTFDMALKLNQVPILFGVCIEGN